MNRKVEGFDARPKARKKAQAEPDVAPVTPELIPIEPRPSLARIMSFSGVTVAIVAAIAMGAEHAFSPAPVTFEVAEDGTAVAPVPEQELPIRTADDGSMHRRVVLLEREVAHLERQLEDALRDNASLMLRVDTMEQRVSLAERDIESQRIEIERVRSAEVEPADDFDTATMQPMLPHVDTLEDDSGEEVVETAIMEEDETANDDAPVAEAAPATVPMPPADILTGSIDPASAQVPASDLTEDLSEFAAADARAQNTRPVTHTRFALGLDLHDTITELKEEWSSLSQRMGNILGGLQARALHQGTEAGTIKYRLVIGPFANAQAAADRCARLQTRGVRCSQTVFGGELIDAGSGALFRVQVVGDGEVDLPVSAEMKGLLDNPPIPRAKPSRS